MGIERYFVHPFTIRRAPVIDGRYGPERDWPNAITVPNPATGWIVGRSLSDSAAAAWAELMRREPEISYWIAQLPAETDLLSTDRVRAHGNEFTVVGEPLPAFTRVDVSHLEALLKNVEG